ncbi:hypothetical protein BH24ACT16_BH24ACT16_17940 [soil metagenome]
MSQADYQRSTWYGADGSNYSGASRPDSSPIDKIVVHITEGSWSSAINWFNDSRANVSAHYVVRSNDGFIGQCVHEKDIAWHAGDWPVNKTSIGIEHEGYGDDETWLTGDLYRSSARLAAYLVRKYDIPIDRDRFIAHNEVSSTACPGQYWDWDRYLKLVRSYARYRRVIDNDSPRFRASSDWATSSWSDQGFRENYRVGKPERVNDPAWFKLDIPETKEYDLFARWPSHDNYNSRAIYLIRTSDGWVRRVRDQTKNGGRWVRLGRFNLDAGDRWGVRLARRSADDGLIIADAIYVREVI